MLSVKVDTRKLNRQYLYIAIKRVFDFCASILGLICLSPLFLILAILIKLDDPKGPVFYSQMRVGKNSVNFRMFKFRSMVTNADEIRKALISQNEVRGPMFKLKHDPRITRVGRVIRKYSLDELPQLLNVVNGSMSLVGPRPPLITETEKYTSFDRQRLLVKPGCTGIWQVGGRNDVDFDEMIRLDLEYITHRSIWLDLKIIFQTVLIMIKPNGAY